MHELMGGLVTVVVFFVCLGITLYVLSLATRLVKAVERIASASEHSAAYAYANMSNRDGSTDVGPATPPT
jgi:hypothetical protein